jgi:hypothetical protein
VEITKGQAQYGKTFAPVKLEWPLACLTDE